MKNYKLNYLLVLIFLAIGCSTSQKSMVNRSQEKNYSVALNNLKKGKSLEKNKELLISSIDAILKSQTIKKDSLINCESLEDKEKGYDISEYLYVKLDESKEYTNGQFDSQIDSLKSEKIDLKIYLKETYYAKGKMDFEKAIKKQDKYLSKKANISLEKSKKYGNEEIDNLIKECSEFSTIYYNVKAKDTESRSYEILIDDQFKQLENLELRFIKINYNKDLTKYDCEIEILFNGLMINDEENSNNQNFSRVIQEQQTQPDGTTITRSVTIRGSVYQRIKKRKLNWDVIMKVNSASNNCISKNSSFIERFISESVINRLSGDERAIPEKYKQSIEQSLLSRREMKEEAIIRVYKKIENELKRNH